MSPKKSNNDAFTSIRVIGKKAQKLLEKARSAKEERGSKPATKKKVAPEDAKMDEVMVHVSIESVAKATLAIIGLLIVCWLAYHLRDKFIILFLAMFVAAVIDPSVQFMERYGCPRGIAILTHYFFAMFAVLFLLISFIPIIATQIQQIAVIISQEVDLFIANPQISLPFVGANANQTLTALVQGTLQDLSINQFADALAQFGRNLGSAASGSVKFATQLAGSVLNFMISLILVLVIAFFVQMEKEVILRWARSFLPSSLRIYMDNKAEAIHTKIGQWARGELILMFTIFSLTLVALIILGMRDYALTLALLAGFCEFIPSVGPFIAAVPAVLIATTQDGFVTGLVVALVYYVIQWCENNLIVPLIMKRAVGLSPVAIIFAMLVAISFSPTIHPILGVIMAVPVTTILTIFLEDWRDRK